LQYFEMHQPEDAQDGKVRQTTEGLWARIRKEARKSWEEAVKESQARVKVDKPNDANLWLTQTG
jgi:hypothetical protein